MLPFFEIDALKSYTGRIYVTQAVFESLNVDSDNLKDNSLLPMKSDRVKFQ